MSNMLGGLESVSAGVVLLGVEITHLVSPVKGSLAKLWALAWQTAGVWSKMVAHR